MSEDLDDLQGKIQQTGSGAYTLCDKCNNDTGTWYADAYVKWAEQAMRLLMAARGQPPLEYPFHLHRLRVLKQIVCMFFSVNNPRFQQGIAVTVHSIGRRVKIAIAAAPDRLHQQPSLSPNALTPSAASALGASPANAGLRLA